MNMNNLPQFPDNIMRGFQMIEEFPFPWERNLEIGFEEGTVQEIKISIPLMTDWILSNDLEVKEKNNIIFKFHSQHKKELEPDFLDYIKDYYQSKYPDRHSDIIFVYTDDFTIPKIEFKSIKPNK